jgi:hypothetical protein
MQCSDYIHLKTAIGLHAIDVDAVEKNPSDSDRNRIDCSVHYSRMMQAETLAL